MTKFISLSDLKGVLGNDYETVNFVNDNIILPFEKINNINDFISKVISVIDFLIKNSLSSSHPYWLGVIENITLELRDILERDIVSQKFDEKKSYFMFLDTIFDDINCPFVGSPIEGLQCIGFLETRGLKFKNIFILDMIDSVMPPENDSRGFISDYIRKKLKINDLKSTSDIYRYYFENIIRSAENVYIYHTDNKKDIRSPLLERIVWDIEKRTGKIDSSVKDTILTPRISFTSKLPEKIDKDDEIKKYLKNFSYSASSLSLYSLCDLKFYYSYVLRLDEKDNIDDDITNRDTGTIMHMVIHEFLSIWENQILVSGMSDGKIEKHISDCVGKVIDENLDSKSPETYFIKKQVLKKVMELYEYLRSERKGYTVLGAEIETSDTLSFNKEKFKINAKSDFIIADDSDMLIVDFKTSSTSDYSLPKFKALETDDFKKSGSLQLPFYILAFRNLFGESKKLNASVILLGLSRIEEDMLYNDKYTFADYQWHFEELIKEEISDIINKKSFDPIDDTSKCIHCDFKNICYG
jgi:hypothetical protein